MAKIRTVKTFLKILAALASLAALWLGSMYVLGSRNDPVICDTITLTGEIAPEMFLQMRDCLVRSTAAKKTFVVKNGTGGDGLAAIAFGTLIHRHGWDVEVTDLCISSCANFIFPAGKTKYLHHDSLLVFHGGYHQANFLDWAQELDRRSSSTGTPVDSLVLGQENKEGVLRYTSTPSKADDEVRAFLSVTKSSTFVEHLGKLRAASDKFYQELGVNPLLPTHGQTGTYEPTYKSYKYYGFIYRLDSLRRLGVRNIELKNAEWRPERNPLYKDFYEVTYP